MNAAQGVRAPLSQNKVGTKDVFLSSKDSYEQCPRLVTTFLRTMGPRIITVRAKIFTRTLK